MVVLKRNLANTLFPFVINSLLSKSLTTILMDIKTDTPRDRSLNNSANNSRESSTYSDMSSVAYTDRVKALTNSSVWADQVENKNFQFSPFSYVIAKGGDDDSTNQVSSIDLNYAPP